MSIEAISEPVEKLLKQVFRGNEPGWPGESDAFVTSFLEGLDYHA